MNLTKEETEKRRLAIERAKTLTEPLKEEFALLRRVQRATKAAKARAKKRGKAQARKESARIAGEASWKKRAQNNPNAMAAVTAARHKKRLAKVTA